MYLKECRVNRIKKSGSEHEKQETERSDSYGRLLGNERGGYSVVRPGGTPRRVFLVILDKGVDQAWECRPLRRRFTGACAARARAAAPM